MSSYQRLTGLGSILGLINKYLDSCHSNEAKARRVKPLDTDWPLTLLCMHTKF